ncbi:hypothetical protein PR048_010400 [Dryococelus australis]|uniref:DDE Tnp4 domain-containing protein n=1 Tax=Dryococelus australis TaxID=614101 RepID=A0ABQ9I2N6_9NEOP|nr:hypothetical protein PR048_010400 [Dryococelus australis]
MLRYKRMYPNRRKRRWSVHPINSARYVDGAFRNLYGTLREDSDKFFNYLRMSITSFDEFVVKCQETIVARRDLAKGLSFSVQEMMVVTLGYLASGCTYTDLHYVFRIGIATASLIVPHTCKVLWTALFSVVFPEFTQDYWYKTAENFKNNAYFPHFFRCDRWKACARYKATAFWITSFYNYKQCFSVVLLAAADANHRFMYIDVGAIIQPFFKIRPLAKRYALGHLNIPNPEIVTNASGPLPCVFVADEAFGIPVNVMRPYPRNHLTDSQRIFNYRLSTAPRFVECAFGMLTNKEDFTSSNEFKIHKLDRFTTYFSSSEGAVAWQCSKI